MTVDKNSWHARVYRWWYKEKYQNEPYITNLCPYMRAVLFWAPARALFGDGIKLGKIKEFEVYLSFVVWPMLLYTLPKLLGYGSFTAKMVFYAVYLLVVGIVAFVATLCAIKLGWDAGTERIPVEFKRATSSFASLTGDYLRSWHDGVCPTIEFD